MALIRPSAASYTNQESVYSGTTKNWTQDMASLEPGQKRYPEPIKRSLGAISAWIDAVADSETHKVDASLLTGSLPAATGLAILQAVYPVGCIYESTVATIPSDAAVFGFGTWEAFAAGQFLLGHDGATYITGDATKGSGGSADAVILAHTHVQQLSSTDNGTGTVTPMLGGADIGSTRSGTYVVDVGNTSSSERPYLSTQSSGVADTGIQNMPPYVVVYRWTRTA